MRIMNKKLWPFQTQVRKGASDDIYIWCQQYLYHGGHYEPNWYYNSDTNTWCFKDKKEYLMFLLKWS